MIRCRLSDGETWHAKIFSSSLRLADQLLPPLKVSRQGSRTDTYFSRESLAHSRLRRRFRPRRLRGLAQGELGKNWTREVEPFLAIAREVPPNELATGSQSKQARKHLEGAMKDRPRSAPPGVARGPGGDAAGGDSRGEGEGLVRGEGREADRGEPSWHLQGPRLLIRTWEKEMMLTPVARFCAGRQGVVDLKVSPTFERAYAVTFKDDCWQIVSLQGNCIRDLSRRTRSPIRSPSSPESDASQKVL